MGRPVKAARSYEMLAHRTSGCTYAACPLLKRPFPQCQLLQFVQYGKANTPLSLEMPGMDSLPGGSILAMTASLNSGL